MAINIDCRHGVPGMCEECFDSAPMSSNAGQPRNLPMPGTRESMALSLREFHCAWKSAESEVENLRAKLSATSRALEELQRNLLHPTNVMPYIQRMSCTEHDDLFDPDAALLASEAEWDARLSEREEEESK